MNVGTFYAHEQGNDRDYVTAGFDLGWGQGADISTDDTLTTVAERLHWSAPDLRFSSRYAPRFRAVVSGRRAAAALPNIEPMLTIEPPPFPRIAGAVCFIPSHTPVRSDNDNSVPQVAVRCKTRRRRIIEAQIPHNLSPRPRHIFLCKRARRQRRA